MGYRKILIVDDEEQILNILEKKLSEEQFFVIRATRGREAIQKAKIYLPDLILMDIMLPDIDGSDAVRLIHKEPAIEMTPIIFLSGIVSKDDISHKASVHVDGTEYPAIGKPFTVQELMLEIRKVLNPGSFPPSMEKGPQLS